MPAKASQTKAKYIQEAEEIYAWLVDRQELAHALIRQSTKGIKHREEGAAARLDLHCLVVRLAAAQSSAKEKATWESYKHHFVGNINRQKFFDDLRKLARRISSAWLVSFSSHLIKTSDKSDEVFLWNDSLLPRESAPHVLRLAILHPGVLEYFLPRYFERASDLSAGTSTFRRAIRILDNVPKYGWSAENHTKALLDSGDMLRFETVKKFIRDLRTRYRRYLHGGGKRPRT